MPLYHSAFWFCAFFLLGIFAISVFYNIFIIVLLDLLVLLVLLVYKRYSFALLSLAIILGVGYFQAFSYLQDAFINLPFDKTIEATGVIEKLEQSSTKQVLVVDLKSPYSSKVRINSRPYPSFSYGDLVEIKGKILPPLPEAKLYYAKEGISGLMNFPAIELVKSGQGSWIFSRLFQFKNKIESVFQQNLPREKAAFLAGLTLGEREDFTKEFQQKMKLSGTTHLVALSGYNISVIILAVGALLGGWFSRRISFYLSVGIIILFVLMTGAEASVVRAAIMGIIALFARHSERQHSVRNAIIIAAFAMVLVNPRVLVFDLGFQLSFAALLGIIYLLPVLKKIFKFKNSGFLNWKDNFLTTLSAQLAVVPFLLGNFGTFSVLSLAANVLIAELIPITMAVGFIMGGLGMVSDFLAGIAGLLANVLLSLELFIIDIFSRITLPIAAESFGFLAAILYYLLLIGFIYKFGR